MKKGRLFDILTFEQLPRKSTVEEKAYRHKLEDLLIKGEISKEEYKLLLVGAIEYGKGVHCESRFKAFTEHKLEVAKSIGAMGKVAIAWA